MLYVGCSNVDYWFRRMLTSAERGDSSQYMNTFIVLATDRYDVSRQSIPNPDKFEDPVARTTVTSFRVIDAMAGRESVGVSELADELSLQSGTIHKHLTTLERLGYVVKENRRYRLSVRFMELGGGVRARMRLYKVAHKPLKKLAEATGKVASIMIKEGNRGVYLVRIRDEVEPKTELFEGEHVPLPATAGGKAILAYLPEEEREAILDNYEMTDYTENTITDKDALRDELQSVRDDRLAHDMGEFNPERHCIAGPITDADRNAIGAVTISGPADRMRAESSEYDYPSIVGSTASSIRGKVIQ